MEYKIFWQTRNSSGPEIPKRAKSMQQALDIKRELESAGCVRIEIERTEETGTEEPPSSIVA